MRGFSPRVSCGNSGGSRSERKRRIGRNLRIFHHILSTNFYVPTWPRNALPARHLRAVNPRNRQNRQICSLDSTQSPYFTVDDPFFYLYYPSQSIEFIH